MWVKLILQDSKAASLTDHVLADMGHGVELFLANLAGELLLSVAVHDLVVLVQRPQLFEGLAARCTLCFLGERKKRMSRYGMEMPLCSYFLFFLCSYFGRIFPNELI